MARALHTIRQAVLLARHHWTRIRSFHPSECPRNPLSVLDCPPASRNSTVLPRRDRCLFHEPPILLALLSTQCGGQGSMGIFWPAPAYDSFASPGVVCLWSLYR